MPLSENPQKPEGYAEKIENLEYMKANFPRRYAEVVYELKDMAAGCDLDGVRAQFYPGWENADFEDLLNEIGESL